MYHLKGDDESFLKNVVFNEMEFLDQKLWPFKWNLACFSASFAMTIINYSHIS